MFKKNVKLIVLLLIACLTLVACGGNDSAETGGSNKDVSELKLRFNNFFKGAYSLDILEKAFTDT